MPLPNTKIAIYDSSKLQCELLSTGLKRLHEELEISCVQDLESMSRSFVHDDKWVVIISDAPLNPATISFVKLLRSRYPEMPLIFLVQEGNDEEVLEAFRSGARGIVCSNEGLAQLAKCIDRVSEGELWLRYVDLGWIFERLSKPAGRAHSRSSKTLLSPREAEVSRLVAEGMSNRDISQTLHLTESTVKNCLFHVFSKLGISNRVELTRYLDYAGKQQHTAESPRAGSGI